MKFRDEMIIGAILLLGLFLRLYGLGAESIWQDEGFSIKVAHMSISQLIVTSAGDVHPPFYYLLLHYWIALFGDSEFSCRSLSALVGVLSIVMIYNVGRLLLGREAGMLSALVLALSEFHIHYSQVARMYSLMALLTLLSFYFFIRLLNEKSFKISISYALCTVLLMYTHVYGLFIVIAQNISAFMILIPSKKNAVLRKWLVLQVMLCGLYLPWAYSLMGQIMRVEKGYWIPVPTALSIVATFKEYAGSAYSLPFFLLPVLLLSVPLRRSTADTPPAGDLSSMNDLRRDEADPAVNGIPLLWVWLLTPVVLPFLISLFSRPIYHFRYTIGASLAFYLLVGTGIAGIRSKPLRILLICLVLLGSFANVRGYYRTTHKAQWRDVARYLSQKAQPGDLIVIMPRGGRQGGHRRGENGQREASENRAPLLSEVAFDYYFKRTDVSTKIFRIGTKKRSSGRDIGELYPMVRDFSRVWVIVRRGVDPEGRIPETLGQHYALADSQKYAGVEVSLFVRRTNR
jgi:mannosyltransferase